MELIIIFMTIILSLLVSVSHTAPLTFNFTNFDQCSDSVKLSGDATCVKSGVQVTGFEYYTAGQAQYSKPMRLWDASTGNLTNFTTTFTFAMDNNQGSWTCDGMAFYIASFNRTFPGTSANTGLFGLVDSNHTYNGTANPFVAVEFDTYNNPDWDVWNNLSHVGVNVNSIQSVTSKRWKSYSDGTSIMWAQISYQARNLCVAFTGLNENLTELPRDSLCYEVDLRDYLAEWAVIGFSGSTAWRYQSHTVKSWSFVSDLDAEGGPNTSNSNDTGKRKKSKMALVAGLGVGIAIVALIMIALIIRAVRRPGNPKNPSTPTTGNIVNSSIKPMNSNNSNPGVSFINPKDLENATNNFSRDMHLGSGGYGTVYKAEFENEVLAVKRLPNHKASDFNGYVAELSTIGQLNHENLVKLRGWSCDNAHGHFYIIYEFMDNSSMDHYLRSDDDDDEAIGVGEGEPKKKKLDWGTRYKIANDVASGLCHLHNLKDGTFVLHRDIKPSNVLLDSNFKAKLGDFGLARIVDQQSADGLQSVQGYTPAYAAPECIGRAGKSSKKSDVFSFGLVALEIAHGGRKKDLAKWVSKLNAEDDDGSILQASDPAIGGDDFDKAEMESLLMVGLHCAHPNPDLRPSMPDAMSALNMNMKPDKFRSMYPAPRPEDYSHPSTLPETIIELSGPPTSIAAAASPSQSTAVGSESPSVPLIVNVDNVHHIGNGVPRVSHPSQTAPNDGGGR